MSNALDRIKNKVRNSTGSSVHAELIDAVIHEEDKQGNIKANANGDVNVNVNTSAFINKNMNENKGTESSKVANASRDSDVDTRTYVNGDVNYNSGSDFNRGTNANGNSDNRRDTTFAHDDGLRQAPIISPPRREKRKKFEDQYRRDTFWIRNDLKEQIDAFCKGERGEKTRIVNEALQEYFNKFR